MPLSGKNLLDKLREMDDSSAHEVEAFVDFLRARAEDRRLRRAATLLSLSAFDEVWDNDDDSAYDDL